MMLKDRVKKIYSIKKFRKNDDDELFCFCVLKVFFKLKLFNFFFYFKIIVVLVFPYCFDVLISKIIF
jgi:hypothetical protein